MSPDPKDPMGPSKGVEIDTGGMDKNEVDLDTGREAGERNSPSERPA